MSRSSPKALILTGYGINCDYETFEACTKAGFSACRVHVNDLLVKKKMLFQNKLVIFPGGFSFGDDLGSGVAFSSKIRFSAEKLYDTLMEYVMTGGLILGICNGFQILVRLGIIPAVHGQYGVQQCTLAPNRVGYFINKWVRLRVEQNCPNIFTKGLKVLRLPVRHGEGRFISRDEETLSSIEDNSQVSLRYCDEEGNVTQEFPHNPNSSAHGIAGICDPSGRIFGLMPHPEAATSIYYYPDWTRRRDEAFRKGLDFLEEGDGHFIFKNAYDYVK